LLIGELAEDKVKTLAYGNVVTDLGEGLASSSVISDAALRRLMKALEKFKGIIAEVEGDLAKRHDAPVVIPVTAIATSAMRDAKNAQEVLAKVLAMGVEVEVISGKREAELSFKGTLSGFDAFEGNVISFDVGGGSTEIILGSHRTGIFFSHSFDMGSRRATESFLTSDPPHASQMQEVRNWLQKHMAPTLAQLPTSSFEVIAVAGTATSAITIRDKIASYDRNLVHGKQLSALELNDLISMLAAMSLEQRMQVTGLHPGRAPVIVGGLIILDTLIRAVGKETLMVSDTDILQGILLQKAAIC